MSDFSEEAKVRIADLGSALKLASPTDTSSFKIGTPGYVAPEILQGQPYSFSCDVWSLGCLLHVLLSATPPFWDEDRKERNRKVCTEPLNLQQNQYMAKLSDSCKDLLNLMLAKDPTQRPTISHVFQHRWFWACWIQHVVFYFLRLFVWPLMSATNYIYHQGWLLLLFT